MLRQKDIIKYKNKSKEDHILFLRKDGEYLLKIIDQSKKI